MGSCSRHMGSPYVVLVNPMNTSTQSLKSNANCMDRIAVFCVGNRLMLDEGIGPAVYDELIAGYDFPGEVELFDVGCMSMRMIEYVRDFDVLISIDAVDGTGEKPGTLFKFKPEDMQRAPAIKQSLHELKLVDLFDSAALLGYEALGFGLGMQIENMSPADLTIGLTPLVFDALPRLVDMALAEISKLGVQIRVKGTNRVVDSSWQHTLKDT